MRIVTNIKSLYFSMKQLFLFNYLINDIKIDYQLSYLVLLSSSSFGSPIFVIYTILYLFLAQIFDIYQSILVVIISKKREVYNQNF